MDLLNKIVEKEIESYEINSICELHLYEKTAQIILSHPMNFSIPKYKKHYEFDECFYLSYDFLKYLNEDYASLLLKRENEGAFMLGVGEQTKDSISISTVINGEYKIYIPYSGDITNSFAVTHEFIHDMTIDKGYNDTRMTFVEVFSLYAELLQSEYLQTREIKEAIIRPREICDIVYSKALENAFEVELIKEKMLNGFITPISLAEIMKRLGYKKELWSILGTILTTENLNFGYEQRYVIGYLLALYMRERNTDHSNKEFFDLNEKLNDYTIPQFMSYLDLNSIYSETLFDLDDTSYQKIEDTYVKQIKKIR